MDHWVDGGVSKANLECLGRRYLILVAELRLEAGDDSFFWKLYPKHHQFAHLVANAESNPKLSWNYALESQIGDAATIAAACNKQHLHRALIERYHATR